MAESISAPPARVRAWSATDALMLAAVMVWGMNFTAIKLALGSFAPLTFNGLRFGLATVVMMGILVWRSRDDSQRDLLSVPRRDWLPVILLGLGGHTIYQVMFINGMAHTTPANSSIIMATSPIWVAIIGYLAKLERINRTMWMGILVSFVGIAVVITSGSGALRLDGSTLKGDLLIVGCAFGWALYTSGSKPLLARYSALKLTAWSMVAGTIPLVAIALPGMAIQDWGGVPPIAWGALLFSSLMAVVIGYLVWYTSVQRIGNARTSVYSNLIPVFAVLFAWLTLGSTLAPLQLAGAAVVLCGLVIARRGRVH